MNHPESPSNRPTPQSRFASQLAEQLENPQPQARSSAKTVLLIGGAGFIGSHVSYLLWRRGYRVVVLDNLLHGHEQALQGFGAELVVGDMSNRQLLISLIRERDVCAVLHFAGFCYVGESVQRPLKYYLNNVARSLVFLDVIQQLNRPIPVVFSSSCATYGLPQFLPMTEAHPQQPINPYGRSKWMFEMILRDCEQAFGLRSACLRYFNASGCEPSAGLGEEHDPETHAIPLILQAALGRAHAFSIFGSDYETPDGTCVRDFVHVRDLASAHLLAMERLLEGAGSFACNLGTGQGTSVAQLVRLAEEVTGRHVPILRGPRRPGDPPYLVADPSLAHQLLGWRAETPDVRDHIRDTWTWMNGPRWGRVKRSRELV